jgi:hypothetical protein
MDTRKNKHNLNEILDINILKNLINIKIIKDFDTWSNEDKIKLLEIYLLISKKEKHIFDLIYRHHGCDSWEDIFRDYDVVYLNDKTTGVEIAIKELKAGEP